ncbi:MAG: rhodanese-like domain-containing protein [Alphaproteobacteria bacterium]|nr:rhodanese-like domain-containing protein [Alphaproteobacteria bacterium]
MMRRLLVGIFSLFAVVALTPAALAQSGETPSTIDGAKTVSPAQVKEMLGKAQILDVRRRASWLEGRVPGAKSIVSEFNKETKSYGPTTFGPDKSQAIVIYGHGSDGWSAVTAVKNAVGAGYSNVHWMRTGFKEWSEQKLPVQN